MFDFVALDDVAIRQADDVGLRVFLDYLYAGWLVANENGDVLHWCVCWFLNASNEAVSFHLL